MRALCSGRIGDTVMFRALLTWQAIGTRVASPPSSARRICDVGHSGCIRAGRAVAIGVRVSVQDGTLPCDTPRRACRPPSEHDHLQRRECELQGCPCAPMTACCAQCSPRYREGVTSSTTKHQG